MTSKRTKDNPLMDLVPTPAIHEVGSSHPVVLNEDIVGNAGRFSSFNNRTDDRDGSHIEATEAMQSRRNRDVMDLTTEGFVSKCLRIGGDDFSVQLPRSAMVTASSSSVTFVQLG